MVEFKHLEEVLNRYGNELVEGYKDQLRQKDINASGDLAQSVRCIIDKGPTSFEISLSLLEYAKWVEKGRKAGKWPPIKAIERWIKVKPVIPRPFKGKVPTEKQLAFLIARKIGLEGTEGKHPLEDTVEKTNREWLEKIELAFMEDIGEQVDNILTLLLNV